MKRIIIITFISMIAIPKVALAADTAINGKFFIEKENGVLKCNKKTAIEPSGGNTSIIVFEIKDQVLIDSVIVQSPLPNPVILKDFSGDLIAALKQKDSFAVSLNKNDFINQKNLTISVRLKGHTDYIYCGKSSTAESNNYFQTPDAISVPQVTTEIDTQASRWWLSDKGLLARSKLFETGQARKLPANTLLLVHLPSGIPAFPFPSGITEGRNIQVAIIVPIDENRQLLFKTTECADINMLRTTFEQPPTVHQSGSAEGGQGNAEIRDFVLVPVGTLIRCGSGNLKYIIASSMESLSLAGMSNNSRIPEIVIRVRPKYHLTGVVAGVWNFGQKSDFEKLNTSDPAIFTIGEKRGPIGPALYLGIQWMIGGVDYEAMRWWNYFANLVVALNPAAPLEDLMIGIAVTPTGGISIIGGVSMHSGKRLTNGFAVNDKFSGQGSIPAESTWQSVTAGGVIGLVLDTRIYDSIIRRFNNSK